MPMTAAEQHRILTEARLKLVSTLITSTVDGDEHIVIKNIPRCTYLTVDRKLLRVLQQFRNPSTLPELLPTLIRDRMTPALRDLYELILKAVENKILVEEDVDVTPVRALEWKVEIGERFGYIMGVLAIVFGFAALLFGGVQPPVLSWITLAGIIPMSIAFSVGYLLAACVLASHKVEVYRPRFHWRTLFPHFKVDLDDARLAGKRCRVTVALLRLVPIFLLAGLCAMVLKPISYVALLGIFYFTKPITSPMIDLLRAMYSSDPIVTRANFIFWLNRKPWHLIKSKIKYSDRRFLLLHFCYAIGWTLVLVFTHLKLLGIDPLEFWQGLPDSDVFLKTLKVVIAVIISFIGVVILINLVILWRFLLRKLAASNLWQRLLTKIPEPGEIQKHHVLDLMDKSMLFRELKPEVRQAAADTFLVSVINSGDYVIKKGDPGDYFYMVFAGKVEVCRPLLSGRRERITDLGPGDCFGETALLRNTTRSHTVRAITKTILLAMPRDAFYHYVVGSLGNEKVIEILQKRAFLARIPLSNNWSDVHIQLFAEKAVLQEYDREETVLVRGQENQFFNIVHEARFRVQIGGKSVAVLKVGDYLGEISLLQNSVVTADVICVEGGRLFSLHRSDFLKILGWDYQLALQFEAIASKRLKKPIFPLTEGSFEVVGSR